MAEKLALEQAGRNRRAVQFDEGVGSVMSILLTLAPMAEPMQRLSG
jgi:hypothetical protein